MLDDAQAHTATIATSEGAITVELWSGRSPATANNFAFLAGEGFYDETPIHRIVPGFVVQMGDPTGTGSGGPGYRFADELEAARKGGYDRGTLAMANAGPNTNGSQFFIMRRRRSPAAELHGVRQGHRRHGRGRPPRGSADRPQRPPAQRGDAALRPAGLSGLRLLAACRRSW